MMLKYDTCIFFLIVIIIILYHRYLNCNIYCYRDCITIIYITASFILPLTRSLFWRLWVCVFRLEIRDIIVPDISRDVHKRLVTYTIHMHLYYPSFIFLFIYVTHIFHDHWLFLQVFLYLFNVEIIVYVLCLFPVLKLSVHTWGYFRHAYVRHLAFPYPRDRGVIE